MEKFVSVMEKILLPIADKLSTNKYLAVISQGCMSALGIIMVGAVFTILTNIQWNPYTSFLASTGLGNLFQGVINVTTNLLAVYMAFAAGYRGATIFNNEKYAITSGFLSLLGFMLLIPLDTTTLAEAGISFFNIAYLGTKGIFVALLSGVIVSKLLAIIIEKNIVIKLPDSIPGAVGESLSSLLSSVIIVVVFLAINAAFKMTSFGNATDCIYSVLQTPLQNLTGNLPAFLLCIVVAQLLWFFGIHGSMTVLPMLFPIWLSYIGENTAAMAAGEKIPHILNIGLWDLANLGGSGATIGLVILMYFTAKSERYKSFGKVTLPCGIFSVNEPVIFGMPIILNTILLIPFVLCPILIVTLGYILIQMGIVTAPIGILGLGSMPPFISGLMQGSLTWGIYQLVCIPISIAIYYPFFKILDKKAVEEENATRTVEE
ncbi:MAG: PTS transporter subunit EIIC [Bacillota bacterium]|nr:PTS transporter subunit EIIC [Bacillota bacterium]